MAALVSLTILVLLLVRESGRRDARHQARQSAAVERKLNLIMDHLGNRKREPDVPAGVQEELIAGRKIKAMKVYRDATGAGLRQVKDAVELLARRQGLG
ncbi:hypothetical protein Afe04nite_03660 [Asanoa ferruginea]|nr:hypothetical protein [Asanoa ferruginea]GIF45827.1 hypothetical protein Afe04nite_03660 [Asanoa ferruginea]